MTGREDPEMPLVFRYEIEVADIGRVDGDVRLLPPIFPSSLTSSFARLASRERTQIVPALAVDVRMTIHAPGASLEPPPDRTFEGREDARLSFTSTPTADGIVVERRVRMHRMRIPPAEYPAFAELCREADEHEQREIRVRTR